MISSGDFGKSDLIKRRGLKKSDLIFDLLGDLDELNSFCGFAKVAAGVKLKRWLEEEQKAIYYFSAWLAGEKKLKSSLESLLANLERKTDILIKKDKSPKNFVIFGKNEISGRLDCLRAICRRAERTAWKFFKNKKNFLTVYLNRFSKALFLLAREQEN